MVSVTLSGVILPQVLLSGGKSTVKPPKTLQIFLQITRNASWKYPSHLAWWVCKGCLREWDLPLDSPSYVLVLH